MQQKRLTTAAKRRLAARRAAKKKYQNDLERMRRLGVALRRKLSPSPRSVGVVEHPEAVLSQPEVLAAAPVELYGSFAEARAAAATVRHQELLAELQGRSSSSGIGLGLAIGLSVVAVLGLGVLLCYVLFRPKETGGLAAAPVVYQLPSMVAPTVLAPTPAPPTKPIESAAEAILEYFKNTKKS